MQSAELKHYRSEFERVRERLPSPWLLAQREAALAELSRSGLPSPRSEQWRYTDLRPIARGTFTAAVDLPEPSLPGILHDYTGLARYELVFLNGCFLPQLSTLEALGQVAEVTRLADCPQPPPALLERWLQEPSEADNGPALLNTAFLSDGVLIRILQGEAEPAPIHLLYLSSGTEPQLAVHPRNVVLLEAQTRAVLVESYQALDENAHLCNALTQVELGVDAHLDHYLIQQGSPRGYHLGTLQVHQQAASRLRSWSALCGAALGRWEVRSKLEENARAELCGVYALEGRRHLDCQVHIDHLAVQTHSSQLFRGVIQDRGRASFSGRVVIHPQAQKADAHQSNANLLLSKQAQAATQPQLEIYADDVKCSHGATVGQPDQDSLFYLHARGLDDAVARKILARAFAQEALQEAALEPVRQRMYSCLGLDAEPGELA